MDTMTNLPISESYSQCRNCGQFHTTTARDCGKKYYPKNIGTSSTQLYRILNGKLYQVKSGSPPVEESDGHDKMREKIAKILTEDCTNTEGNCSQPANTRCKYCVADQILMLIEEARYVQLDPDQSLPDNPYNFLDEVYSLDADQSHECYSEAQQDMLKQGWEKVKDANRL